MRKNNLPGDDQPSWFQRFTGQGEALMSTGKASTTLNEAHKGIEQVFQDLMTVYTGLGQSYTEIAKQLKLIHTRVYEMETALHMDRVASLKIQALIDSTETSGKSLLETVAKSQARHEAKHAE